MTKIEITIRKLDDGTYRSFMSSSGEQLPSYATEEITIGTLNAVDKLNRRK